MRHRMRLAFVEVGWRLVVLGAIVLAPRLGLAQDAGVDAAPDAGAAPTPPLRVSLVRCQASGCKPATPPAPPNPNCPGDPATGLGNTPETRSHLVQFAYHTTNTTDTVATAIAQITKIDLCIVLATGAAVCPSTGPFVIFDRSVTGTQPFAPTVAK